MRAQKIKTIRKNLLRLKTSVKKNSRIHSRKKKKKQRFDLRVLASRMVSKCVISTGLVFSESELSELCRSGLTAACGCV